jgi:predicted ATPase
MFLYFFFPVTSTVAGENIRKGTDPTGIPSVTTDWESDGPIGAYRKLIASGHLQHDDCQMSVVERLQDLNDNLDDYEPPSTAANWLAKVFKYSKLFCIKRLKFLVQIFEI